MARDVNYVVSTTHDEYIAFVINKPTVSGQVVARIGGEITLLKPGVVTPNCWQTARRQWTLNHDTALLSGLGLFPRWIKDLDLEPWRGFGRRTCLWRKRFEPTRV